MNKNQQGFQSIDFPLTRKEDWREILPRKLVNLQPGLVIVNCSDWLLSCKDFQKITAIFEKSGLRIKMIQSNIPQTIVSASSLGYPTFLCLKTTKESSIPSRNKDLTRTKIPCLLFHQGTLRSGENLEAEGDVL